MQKDEYNIKTNLFHQPLFGRIQRRPGNSKRFEEMKQLFKGIIVGASQVESYTRKDGTQNYRCTLALRDVNSDPYYPLELAVSVSGESVSFASQINGLVEVEYVVRVFSYTDRRTGKPNFGNDIYCTSIRRVQP